MLLFLLNHKLLSGMIWILIVCGVSTQIILGVRMQRLLEEMDQISATKNSFLNKCRICPEGTNPRNHVDNMMENYRIWGCMPATWKALSGQAMMLSVVLSGVGVCIGIARGETIGSLLPYYVFCMIGLYAYFAISGAVDAKGRMEKIKEKLYAYFEQKCQEQEKPETMEKNDIQTSEKEQDCTLELVELLDELLI